MKSKAKSIVETIHLKSSRAMVSTSRANEWTQKKKRQRSPLMQSIDQFYMYLCRSLWCILKWNSCLKLLYKKSNSSNLQKQNKPYSVWILSWSLYQCFLHIWPRSWSTKVVPSSTSAQWYGEWILLSVESWKYVCKNVVDYLEGIFYRSRNPGKDKLTA